MISVSGIFSVTFSVIFAYVADVTQEHERITAYGRVRYTKLGEKKGQIITFVLSLCFGAVSFNFK